MQNRNIIKVIVHEHKYNNLTEVIQLLKTIQPNFVSKMSVFGFYAEKVGVFLKNRGVLEPKNS